ncbi:MAG: TRAP transporter fused permease subunit [Deferribacterota bacterium]|nr:TRAP transporter fused permease subunit [Deferribacterota bacterium]
MNIDIISAKKELPIIGKYIIYTVAVLSSLFHLWVNTIGVIPEIERNAIHYIFMLSLVFLMYPAFGKNRFILFDYLCLLLVVAVGFYLLIFDEALHARNEVMVVSDVIFATAAVLILFEATRRAVGLTIPILSLIFISYALFLGDYFEGIWNFPGVTYTRLMYRMYFAPDGIFGSIATISSTFVILFVIFASFLLYSGAGSFIINLAMALMGKRVGGPAKIAVFASGIMGSISGSAVANTSATGSITIPLMKRVGFKAEFAAAVEAAASTGGQILPPIMGAGAFIMSQWTGISYVNIILVAFMPAILYYITIIFYVHLRAKKKSFAVLKDEEIPNIKDVLKDGWSFIIPIIILIGLLIYGYTPTFSAAVGIIAVVVCSYFNKNSRMGLHSILDALALGSLNMVTTGTILLCAGIVVEVIILTGLGLKFSMLISMLAGHSLIITLLLVALAATILGMGLPVTASYIVLAVLTAPSILALMNAGYLAAHFNISLQDALNPQVAQGLMHFIPENIKKSSLLAAHMAIFWFSQTSNVTPPICLASYAAAGIAKADPIKTGFISLALAKGLYIIPFLFIYTPILFTGPLFDSIETIILATIGLFSLAVLFEGYYITTLNTVYRLFFGLSGLLMLLPSFYYHIAGLCLFIIMTFILFSKKKATSHKF